MALIEYELDEHVAVLTMNSGENRFNFDFYDAILPAFDEIENNTEASVLVVRSGDKKIWSNGIDLDWLGPAAQEGGPEVRQRFMRGMNELFRRILTYPMITIAAINGHAFAGGAFMACCFDFRFMRSDRGWFCFPEVDLKMPFRPSFIPLVKKAVPMYKFEEMKYTGKRVTAPECEEHHIVMKACHNDDLMNEVMAFAKGVNKDRGILKIMKQMMNKEILDLQIAEDEGKI
jgi:enoyl-CoA hydratase/carnithine racemase